MYLIQTWTKVVVWPRSHSRLDASTDSNPRDDRWTQGSLARLDRHRSLVSPRRPADHARPCIARPAARRLLWLAANGLHLDTSIMRRRTDHPASLVLVPVTSLPVAAASIFIARRVGLRLVQSVSCVVSAASQQLAWLAASCWLLASWLLPQLPPLHCSQFSCSAAAVSLSVCRLFSCRPAEFRCCLQPSNVHLSGLLSRSIN